MFESAGPRFTKNRKSTCTCKRYVQLKFTFTSSDLPFHKTTRSCNTKQRERSVYVWNSSVQKVKKVLPSSFPLRPNPTTMPHVSVCSVTIMVKSVVHYNQNSPTDTYLSPAANPINVAVWNRLQPGCAVGWQWIWGSDRHAHWCTDAGMWLSCWLIV